MRGLRDAEKAILDVIVGHAPCLGSTDIHGRSYTEAEMQILEGLLEQRRLTLYVCACGMRHFALTPEGLEARRIEALARHLT